MHGVSCYKATFLGSLSPHAGGAISFTVCLFVSVFTSLLVRAQIFCKMFLARVDTG